ncbi:MAG: hypothetical protein R2860_10495 [Desulfobacterales bacterium]
MISIDRHPLHWHGHPIEEARLWVHQACLSPCPTTKKGYQPMRMANATANCAKIIEDTCLPADLIR